MHACFLRWVVENVIDDVTGAPFATSHFGDVFLFMTFHLHKPGNVVAGHIYES